MAQGVRWRVYAAGPPFVTLMPRLSPLLLSSHFRKLADLEEDVASEAASDWPQVIFVEPDYRDCPIHLSAPVPTPCDNHAPLAMAPGEAFLGYVYRLLASNAAKWARTALVVTYDEHGGFFDHVAPPVIAYRTATSRSTPRACERRPSSRARSRLEPSARRSSTTRRSCRHVGCEPAAHDVGC